MVNYQNSKIYKIVDNTNNNIYIGSTTKPLLSQRLAQHCFSYKSWLKGNGRRFTSYQIIANGNYDIVLLETYQCNSKDELYAREKYYIQNNTCVNRNSPFQTNQDMLQYQKNYYVNNKAKIQQRRIPVFNCVCGGCCKSLDKSRHFKSLMHKTYLNNQNN